MKNTLVLTALISLFSFTVHAGVYLEQEITAKAEGKTHKSKIKMDVSKYGMKVYGMATGQPGKKNPAAGSYMLMNREGQMLQVIPSQKTYMDMAEMMRNAQRFMGNKQNSKTKYSFKKIGPSKKLGKKCMMFKVMEGKKAVSESCLAKMSDLGLSKSDLKSFDRIMTNFNNRMEKYMPKDKSMPSMDEFKKLVGGTAYPIWVRFLNNKESSVMTLAKIESRSYQSSQFQPPKGYKKFVMPVFNPNKGMDPAMMEKLKKQMEEMKKNGK